MNKALLKIRQKMRNLPNAILRYHEGEERKSLQVNTTPGDHDLVYCKVDTKDMKDSLDDKFVNLIQKQNNDYFYITGKVADSSDRHGKFIAIKILKASWFIRKTKGTVSWLQEESVYERQFETGMELAQLTI